MRPEFQGVPKVGDCTRVVTRALPVLAGALPRAICSRRIVGEVAEETALGAPGRHPGCAANTKDTPQDTDARPRDPPAPVVPRPSSLPPLVAKPSERMDKPETRQEQLPLRHDN